MTLRSVFASPIENSGVTCPSTWLGCDRDGRLGMALAVPEGMFDLMEAPWTWVLNAVRAEALPDEGRGAWVVPGMEQVGEDSEAAIEATYRFRKRLVAALGRAAPDP